MIQKISGRGASGIVTGGLLRVGYTTEVLDNIASLNDKEVVLIETQGNAILVGDTYVITLTSNLIKAASAIFPSVSSGTNTFGVQTISRYTVNDGNVEIEILNISAQALSMETNGTLILAILILN